MKSSKPMPLSANGHDLTLVSVNKLAIPTSYGYEFILTKDIIRCEADANYTNFYMIQGKRMIVSRSLKEYEKILSSHNFIRVHQSHLINLDHIAKYLREGGGYIMMDDESIVEISRRKRGDFLTRLKNKYLIPTV